MSNDPQDDLELDAQLRSAMAALDRATPEATFDGLLDRAMARLDDPSIGELPALRVADEPDDDVKDLRALASETKARLSSRRTTEELGASASASWKSVAMPEPARVVEVPPAPPPRRRIRPLVGGLGVALAAAAGAVVVVTMQSTKDQAPAAMGVTQVRPETAERGEVAIAPMAAAPTPAPVTTPPAVAMGKTATKPSAPGRGFATKPSKKPAPSQGYIGNDFGKADPAPVSAGSAAGSGSVDPIEGVINAPGPTHTTKGKAARSSLSTDDIKRAMTAVEPRARACFAGTAGLASVRLAVAPSGQVEKVTVTGPFGGTPVGACVERAVRSAAFPTWDGAPQSFNYSYLLSDP